VWKAWYWGTWLGAREMQAIWMKVITSSSVAIPKFLGEQILWLQASNSILFGTLPVKTKNDMIFQKFGGPWPPGYAYGYKKERKRKNSTYLIFSLPLTKSSQQHNTARHCRTPVKCNIASIGCYVWLLPTRLPANRYCFLKLYTLVH